MGGSAVFVKLYKAMTNRRFKFAITCLIAFIALFGGANLSSAQTSTGRDTVVVLPFENSAAQPEFNWVGIC